MYRLPEHIIIQIQLHKGKTTKKKQNIPYKLIW